MANFNYLKNELQKELCQKVFNLLLDMPRRLTKEDAEEALCQAWSKSFSVSLGRYVMIRQDDLRQMYTVLAVGATPKEALEAWIKYDPWAKDEIHSYRIDELSLRSNGKDWRLEFVAGADRLVAEGIYTIGKAAVGGAVMTGWKTAEEVKKAQVNWDELIRVEIIKTLIEEGWHKSCCVDIYSITSLDADVLSSKSWRAEGEVYHEKRKKFEAKGIYLKDSVAVQEIKYISYV